MPPSLQFQTTKKASRRKAASLSCRGTRRCKSWVQKDLVTHRVSQQPSWEQNLGSSGTQYSLALSPLDLKHVFITRSFLHSAYFLFPRSQWEIAAVPSGAAFVWCLCGLDWPVSFLPPGCGSPTNADGGGYGTHVQFHPSHHAGDYKRRGTNPWLVQRTQHELGQRSNCSGNKLHNL